MGLGASVKKYLRLDPEQVQKRKQKRIQRAAKGRIPGAPDPHGPTGSDPFGGG
jgi:hypothetical protein